MPPVDEKREHEYNGPTKGANTVRRLETRANNQTVQRPGRKGAICVSKAMKDDHARCTVGAIIFLLGFYPSLGVSEHCDPTTGTVPAAVRTAPSTGI